MLLYMRAYTYKLYTCIRLYGYTVYVCLIGGQKSAEISNFDENASCRTGGGVGFLFCDATPFKPHHEYGDPRIA